MLTQKRLKEVLEYDPETGAFVWLNPAARCMNAGDIAGSLRPDGYRRICVDGTRYYAHLLAWLYVYGYFPEHELDHIDRVKDANYILNLREVTRSCNQRNTGNRASNSSGVKGVSWVTRDRKWRAEIVARGRTVHLCLHEDFLEAACHRLAAEQAENWEGCDSSSPAHKYVMKEIRNVA